MTWRLPTAAAGLCCNRDQTHTDTRRFHGWRNQVESESLGALVVDYDIVFCTAQASCLGRKLPSKVYPSVSCTRCCISTSTEPTYLACHVLYHQPGATRSYGKTHMPLSDRSSSLRQVSRDRPDRDSGACPSRLADRFSLVRQESRSRFFTREMAE